MCSAQTGRLLDSSPGELAVVEILRHMSGKIDVFWGRAMKFVMSVGVQHSRGRRNAEFVTP